MNNTVSEVSQVATAAAPTEGRLRYTKRSDHDILISQLRGVVGHLRWVAADVQHVGMLLSYGFITDREAILRLHDLGVADLCGLPEWAVE